MGAGTGCEAPAAGGGGLESMDALCGASACRDSTIRGAVLTSGGGKPVGGDETTEGLANVTLPG